MSEALIMSKLPTHKHIVQFIGISVPPNPLSLVLEFCPKGSSHMPNIIIQFAFLTIFIQFWYLGSLSSLLIRTTLTPDQKYRFLHQIALGMQHLHTYHIIHRDLAARNILVIFGKVKKEF